MRFFHPRLIYYDSSISEGVLQTMPILLSMAFGENLRKLRKENGLTQQELAEKAGVSQQLIGHYENGFRAPKLEKAILLAKALGVPVETINGQLERKRQADGAPHKHRNSRAIKMQEIFEQLPPEKQKSVLDHAKALVSKARRMNSTAG